MPREAPPLPLLVEAARCRRRLFALAARLAGPWACGALLTFSCVCCCRDAAKDEPESGGEGGGDGGAPAAAAAAAALRGLPTRIPVQYDRLGRELQKWIQCNSCEKWRKVPYGLDDSDLPDSWQCRDNVWDAQYTSCDVQQQVGKGWAAAWLAGRLPALLLACFAACWLPISAACPLTGVPPPPCPASWPPMHNNSLSAAVQ